MTAVRATGVAIREPLPWAELAELAESVEETGYSAIFVPEIAGREAFSQLTALAAVTERVSLGTGVVAMDSRDPVITAMAAATVQERSGGRMILGIGTGGAWRGALDRLKERVRVIRELLSGETVEVHGGRTRLSLTLEAPPPLWISALGPRAMRLAGEVADGVLLNWCPPERVAFARDRVREGAEMAGRDPSAVGIGVYVRACVGQDEPAALAALREAAGTYASYRAYARQLTDVGLGAEAEAAAAAHDAGRREDVPEALVRALCLLGDAPDAIAGLRAFRDAGADLPVVYPVPCRDPLSSILGTVFALAPSPVVAP